MIDTKNCNTTAVNSFAIQNESQVNTVDYDGSNVNVLELSSSSSDDDDDDTIEKSDGNHNNIHNNNNDTNKKQNEHNKHRLNDGMKQYATIEDKLVNRWRRIFIISILVAGAIVCSIAYTMLRKEESDDSTEAYVLFVDTINDSFQFHVKAIFDANRGLSHQITSMAMKDNAEFPYYAIPNFEASAHDARLLASFETIGYAPIIYDQEKWINFTQMSRGWLDESKYIYDLLEPGKNRSLEPLTPPLPSIIFSVQNDTVLPRVPGGTFVSSFHISPPPLTTTQLYQNVDLYSVADLKSVSDAATLLKDAVFTKYSPVYAENVRNTVGEEEEENDHLLHPHSIAAQPVFDTLDSSSHKVIGYIYSTVAWDHYLSDLLPEDVTGIQIVLYNSCNQSVTYQLNGDETILVGEGDLHDPNYDYLRETIDISKNYFDPSLAAKIDGHCQYFVDIYPTDEFMNEYKATLPIIFTVVIGVLFVMMAATFAVYDWFVHTRNKKVVGVAARSNAIVSSLFPETIRDRLLEQQQQDNGGARERNLKGFLTSNESEWNNKSKASLFETKPIADLFPETTIIFADIVNFTSWSSIRDPSQVFTLLEVVYNAFDEIARKRGVFKVETIGDCYVAVCGLPEPAHDHAVRMARFANDCMNKMNALVNMLQSTLGPDTCDLTMRMGLHSGPVTAGVLRGERSRFQLFGDTMNTAARMESTGLPDCIQISQVTADLLIAAGKHAWIKQRNDMVNAKGKGLMQTYFLEINRNVANSSSGGSSLNDSSSPNNHSFNELGNGYDSNGLDCKNSRLVDWITELLMPFIKEIAARRRYQTNSWDRKSINETMLRADIGNSVLGEVKEIITLPNINSMDVTNDVTGKTDDVVLDPNVVIQLRQYISNIALMYPDNPFHNFEHASHVTMSVQKLLSRIIAPSDLDRAYEIKSLGADKTYGITSDPLTQFSCLFSAVIHDVDHPGVPNTTLVAEQTTLATKYNNKSIAEQNSVDLAWDLLMKDEYKTLRSAIYNNDDELRRFRQLIVNSVMATDIADKDQKVFRNARWDRAFHEQIDENEQDSINRKATIVIEHLIQASDVAHTMQHWHIYRKWNQRYFEECYRAYKMGRSNDIDPSIGWYEGEIGFFDYYIIPLAKKLKDCGVFGVSSDEYLNYAIQNRNEWKDRGQELVNEMIEKVCHTSTNNKNEWNNNIIIRSIQSSTSKMMEI